MTIFHETESGTFVDCVYCDKRDHIANHFWSEEKDAPACSDCFAKHEFDCVYCDKRDHIANHVWSEEKDAPACSDCYALHEEEDKS